MYTIIRARSRETLVSELPSFGAALVIAETFYKFKSFLLETGAFLATWLALSLLIWLVVRPKPALATSPDPRA